MVFEHQLRTEEAIRAHLARAHADSAKAPIVGPDRYGAFPGSGITGLLHREALLVVPDANVLRRDIGRSCLTGRTVLITAANTGALRLFCAEHVIREVFEHGEEWAEQLKVDSPTYLDRWRNQYLPLLRVVPDSALSIDLLSPAEAERVRVLQEEEDPDDVPSAILSLVLGAFYLTLDRPARYAVYDEDVDSEELENWARVLMDCGDAGELGKMLFAVIALPGLAVSSLFDGIRSLAQNHPWVLAAIAGGVAVVALRTPPETYKKIGSGLLFALSLLNDLYQPYSEALDRFRKTAPAIPTLWELSETNERHSIRTRACLYTLARLPSTLSSAQELANALPSLPVGRGAQLVRETLRNNRSFAQPYIGRWQVGYPARAISLWANVASPNPVRRAESEN